MGNITKWVTWSTCGQVKIKGEFLNISNALFFVSSKCGKNIPVFLKKAWYKHSGA